MKITDYVSPSEIANTSEISFGNTNTHTGNTMDHSYKILELINLQSSIFQLLDFTSEESEFENKVHETNRGVLVKIIIAILAPVIVFTGQAIESVLEKEELEFVEKTTLALKFTVHSIEHLYKELLTYPDITEYNTVCGSVFKAILNYFEENIPHEDPIQALIKNPCQS